MSEIFSTHERRHPSMEKLARYLEQRLAEHREENDSPLTPEQTATLRGRIAELKHVQDLLATGKS